MLNEECLKIDYSITSGFYMGEMEQKDLDETTKKQVILATFAMASEGLDIPDMDTVILTTPMSSVQQSVGRIIREVKGKKKPIVVDFVDEIGICKRMAMKRVNEYKKLKYKVI